MFAKYAVYTILHHEKLKNRALRGEGRVASREEALGGGWRIVWGGP